METPAPISSLWLLRSLRLAAMVRSLITLGSLFVFLPLVVMIPWPAQIEEVVGACALFLPPLFGRLDRNKVHLQANREMSLLRREHVGMRNGQFQAAAHEDPRRSHLVPALQSSDSMTSRGAKQEERNKETGRRRRLLPRPVVHYWWGGIPVRRDFPA